MTLVNDGIEYISAAAVAEQLETTEMKVLMLLRQKALCGQMIEGSWFVTAASLASFDRELAEPGALKGDCSTSCSGAGCGCR